MLVKVCGLQQYENTTAVVRLKPDLAGVILYPPSKRYVGTQLGMQVEQIKASQSQLVFVTVNHNEEELCKLVSEYSPDYVQLHGDESIDYCQRIRRHKVNVIKAIPVENENSFKDAALYDSHVDVLLFDTSCKTYGGSGRSFNWNLLQHYQGKTDFLLSGGIAPQHHSVIQELAHPKLIGVDINSCFEDAPGVKNIELISQFLHHLKVQ
jgi:phosphoribosylanthranilate isomerase